MCSTKYNKNNFDVPVFGLTEMKLIRAEAESRDQYANKDTVLADINDISRALMEAPAKIFPMRLWRPPSSVRLVANVSWS